MPESSEHPHDELTELANEMVKGMEHRLDPLGVKGVVMLTRGNRGGIHAFGYEDMEEALADMMSHMQAFFEAQGIEVRFLRGGRG